MCWADPRFFWRTASRVLDPRPANPPPTDAYYEYVPFPCRLLPERVIEYPSVYELPDELVERIYEWEGQHLSEKGEHLWEYESDLSVCEGSKIGGYVRVIQSLWVPGCECGEEMEHLLTVESMEWNGVVDQRWTPLEEQALFAPAPARWEDWDEKDREIQRALWNPTGLMLGDAGHMQLFVCRRCPGWPITPTIECS
jgi:hypothetical protein